MSVSGTAASTVAGRIGPNAIIRMVEALDAFEGRPVAKRIFAASGNAHYLAELPSEMVPEVDVTALHREVHTALGDSRARSVAWIAGRRTLLTHRIPKLA